MYQNKTFTFILFGLSLLFASYALAAPISKDSIRQRLEATGEKFVAGQPHILDNPILFYTFIELGTPERLEEAAKGASRDMDVFWEECVDIEWVENNAYANSNLRNGTQNIAWSRFTSLNETEREDRRFRCTMQRQLSRFMVHGPGLKELLNSEKYDEAIQYAHEKKVIRLVIQSAAMALIAPNEFSLDQMVRFYEAGSRNWAYLMNSGWLYEGRDPKNNRLAEMRDRATKNYNSNKQHEALQYPNFMYHNSQTPKLSITDKVAPYFKAAVVGLVTAGVGTAIGGYATVAANSAGIATTTTTTATVGGVTTSVTSTTLAGTAISVASNATAGALVGAATGQDFGEALTSGIIGGIVGTGVGYAADAVKLDGAMTVLARGNETVGNYLTATVTGTASGTLLNGGDINAAFTSAATSTAQSALTQGALSLAEKVIGSTSEEPIVSTENQATGAIDFSQATQSNYRTSDDLFGTEINYDVAFQGTGGSSDPFAEVQNTIDFANSANRSVAEAVLTNQALQSAVNTTVASSILLASNQNKVIPNLLSSPDLLYKTTYGDKGEVCVANSCRLIQSITDNRAQLLDPSDFTFKKDGITFIFNDGTAETLEYDDPDAVSKRIQFESERGGTAFTVDATAGNHDNVSFYEALYKQNPRQLKSALNARLMTHLIEKAADGSVFLIDITAEGQPGHQIIAQKIDGTAVFAGNYSRKFGGPEVGSLEEVGALNISTGPTYDTNERIFHARPVTVSKSAFDFDINGLGRTGGALGLVGAGGTLLREGVNFIQEDLNSFAQASSDLVNSSDFSSFDPATQYEMSVNNTYTQTTNSVVNGASKILNQQSVSDFLDTTVAFGDAISSPATAIGTTIGSTFGALTSSSPDVASAALNRANNSYQQIPNSIEAARQQVGKTIGRHIANVEIATKNWWDDVSKKVDAAIKGIGF